MARKNKYPSMSELYNALANQTEIAPNNSPLEYLDNANPFILGTLPDVNNFPTSFNNNQMLGNYAQAPTADIQDWYRFLSGPDVGTTAETNVRPSKLSESFNNLFHANKNKGVTGTKGASTVGANNGVRYSNVTGASPAAPTAPITNKLGPMFNKLTTYAKAHPFMTGGLGLTGAASLAGLFDNDQIGGQLLGTAAGAGLGYGILPKVLGTISPQAKLLATLGGSAVGSLFDSLRAKQIEEQKERQYQMQMMQMNR